MNFRFLVINLLALFNFKNEDNSFGFESKNSIEVNTQRLKQACICGSLSGINNIIKEGIDIRMNDNMAIKTAIDCHHTCLVKSMFEFGCNSFDVIEHMLMTVSKNGNKELAEFALKTGKCSKGFKSYAIAEAVLFGKLDIVEMIFENGAEPEVNGYLVTVAKLKGFTDIIEYLAGKGIKVDTNYDDKALRWASGLGHLDIIELLLKKGANIHANDDDALRVASFNGNAEVVKFLIGKGANIHATDNFALKWAIKHGNIDLVEFLLDEGADIHSNNDETLRSAIDYGHSEVTKLLISRGANILAKNDEALQRAILNDSTEAIKNLNHEVIFTKDELSSLIRSKLAKPFNLINLLLPKDKKYFFY